jgi:hypothetical protein
MKQTDPLFIAEFEGGHQTCTAVFCSPDQLDPARGVMLARRAYSSLRKSAPPAIVRAHFEFNGTVLRRYDAAELDIVGRLPPLSLSSIARRVGGTVTSAAACALIGPLPTLSTPTVYPDCLPRAPAPPEVPMEIGTSVTSR